MTTTTTMGMRRRELSRQVFSTEIQITRIRSLNFAFYFYYLLMIRMPYHGWY